MSTSLFDPISQESDNHIDWVGLYLADPAGPQLTDFVTTVNTYFQENSPDISPNELNQKFSKLITQFGRFWIDSNKLYYRTPVTEHSASSDVYVERIHVNNRTITVNGNPVPTICLAQLEVLLKKYKIHNGYLKQIKDHHHIIEKAIERTRVTF